MIVPAVSTMRRGSRAAICHGAKVALFGTCGVRAAVFRLAMVQSAHCADGVVVFTDGGRVAVPLTVVASSSLVGRVSSLDFPLAREKEDVGAHLLNFLRGSCDNDRRGEF